MLINKKIQRSWPFKFNVAFEAFRISNWHAISSQFVYYNSN